MRTALTIVVITAVIGLAVVPTRDQAARLCAQNKGDIAANAVSQWDVKGYGRTQEEAVQDALKNAGKLLHEHLLTLQPPISYVPTAADIKKLFVNGEPEPKTESDQELQAGDKVIHLECWVLPVKAGPDQYRKLAELEARERQRLAKAERDARIDARLPIAGRVLLCIMALLTVAYGYLRVEQKTKGYYLLWLRVAALGFVGATALGVWMIP